MSILTADRLVTADGDFAPGWLETTDGVVTALGAGDPPSAADESVSGTVIPGFVDIHCHGAAGFDFGSADASGIRAATAFHLGRGTTRLLASVATAPLDDLERSIRTLVPFVADGTLAGIHLEGPYLSVERRGAHDPSLLRTPDLGELRRLVDAGEGTVRLVTIAPELPGALDCIRFLVDAGVTVALGHSDADAVEARAGLDAGASVVTHLFNGMRPLHHREAGLAGVALLDDRVTVELILDGIHVTADTTEIVRRLAPSRLALISDSMAATGCGDGDFTIAGSAVRVTGGIARLAGGDSLAGSTITVADGFRMLVDVLDAPLSGAVAASSSTPASAVGLRAGLAVGAPVDLVVLSGSVVTRVMRSGTWLE